MKQSTVKFLAAATVIVAVGAMAASKWRASGTQASMADEPVLPVLQDRVNDVNSVVIESKDGAITLTRGGDGWVLAEKDGYTANGAKVRELILALRDARVIEEKTANQERFDRLGLDDPGAADSTSKRVTMKAEGGDTIASLLIGDQRVAKGGPAPAANPNVTPGEQYYLHPEGDGPALLATGELRIDARPVGWIDQQLLDIGPDRIQGARVTHPNGAVIEAARAEMSDTELELIGIPEGMQPKEPSGTRPFLDALARLRFDDVQKADSLTWDAAEVTTAELFTEHGLVAKVESMEVQNDSPNLDPEGNPLPGQTQVWARFSFEMVNATTELVIKEREDPAGDSPEGEATPSDPAPSEAEQAKELADLQKSTRGWAYALPSWKTSGFRLKEDEVFEPIPEPELPPEFQPAADNPATILDDTKDN
ncbi:MAG: hypothetical protein ACJAZN_003624 [Planctomycetota bacterium]|jgi:hypothetical protein